MASSEEIDGADLPTKPLPADLPVAAHVPITDLPTAPLTPPAEGLAPAAPGSGRRTWLGVTVALLAAAAIAAVITGLAFGGQSPTPAPSPSLSSAAPTTSVSPTPHHKPTTAPPPPPVQPPGPTEPPASSAPPQPTDTPTP